MARAEWRRHSCRRCARQQSCAILAATRNFSTSFLPPCSPPFSVFSVTCSTLLTFAGSALLFLLRRFLFRARALRVALRTTLRRLHLLLLRRLRIPRSRLRPIPAALLRNLREQFPARNRLRLRR